VPFAAGGSTDLVARFIAERMRDRLGQTIVVENRPGANAIVGTQFTAKSAPDGYTLQLGGVSTHAINPHLRKSAALRRHQGLHLARPDRDGTAGHLREPERSGQGPFRS
jgi:tripartite-type tricarboxylate transporter receptor subunit TctC